MSDDTYHVMPVGDLIVHDIVAEVCPCGPQTRPVMRRDGSNAWMVVHHSLDGREAYES